MDENSKRLVALALAEDIGPMDVTSQLIPADQKSRCRFCAREDLTLAGIEAAHETFRQLDPQVVIRWHAGDGDFVGAGSSFGELSGPTRSLLSGERTALNFLQRLCGIATLTKDAVSRISGTQARIVDTRKTTPGLRTLEKAAVRAGGGHNHRMGLFDGVLIKDNHIAANGSITAAIQAARSAAHHLLKIMCEVDTLTQLDEALAARADLILLDNMDLLTLRLAVERTNGRVPLEASGNMRLDRLRDVAATGVDFISMGILTHSARAMDIGLDWEDAR
jgi:nicotinate-nucleotide pyrophosphorylase (carboxylating)